MKEINVVIQILFSNDEKIFVARDMRNGVIVKTAHSSTEVAEFLDDAISRSLETEKVIDKV